jgi:hypothetical protein
MIALSIFAAVPALAFNVEPRGSNEQPMGDTWCERNHVMMVNDGYIIPLQDCGELTCTPVRNWDGYRYRNGATCLATGDQSTNK